MRGLRPCGMGRHSRCAPSGVCLTWSKKRGPERSTHMHIATRRSKNGKEGRRDAVAAVARLIEHRMSSKNSGGSRVWSNPGTRCGAQEPRGRGAGRSHARATSRSMTKGRGATIASPGGRTQIAGRRVGLAAEAYALDADQIDGGRRPPGSSRISPRHRYGPAAEGAGFGAAQAGALLQRPVRRRRRGGGAPGPTAAALPPGRSPSDHSSRRMARLAAFRRPRESAMAYSPAAAWNGPSGPPGFASDDRTVAHSEYAVILLKISDVQLRGRANGANGAFESACESAPVTALRYRTTWIPHSTARCKHRAIEKMHEMTSKSADFS